MSLYIKLDDIDIPSGKLFKVFYASGRTPGGDEYQTTWGTQYGGLYTGGTTPEIDIDFLSIDSNPYGKQYWFKLQYTGDTHVGYILENIYIHNQTFYQDCLNCSTPTPTPTISASPTPTVTPTPTFTSTPAATSPETPSPTPTESPTNTPTPTETPTNTPTPTPTNVVGDFTLSPAYDLSFDSLSVNEANVPTFTFPMTGQTTNLMSTGYTSSATFTVVVSGTRNPSVDMNISLILNSVTILDCQNITSDPSSTSFLLTTGQAVSIGDDLTISIGTGLCTP